MIKLTFLFKRKPDMTPEQFRDHYENRHVPLALRLLPYFSDYARNYIRHDLAYRPAGLGVDNAPEFDVVTEVTFATAADYDLMMKQLAEPAVSRQIIEDEERFMDRKATLMFFVDEERTPQARLKPSA
jgi:EthD domain